MSTLYGMMSGGPQTQESQRVPFPLSEQCENSQHLYSRLPK